MNKFIAAIMPALTLQSNFYKVSPAKLTVASALAGFEKVKTDLAKVKAVQDAEAVRNALIVEQASQAADAAQAEAARAARALAKVEQFLA